MEKDFVAGIEELNATTVKSVKRLGEIQLRTMERLTEQQIAVTSELMREGVKQMQSFAGVKDLSKLFENQASYMSDFGKRAVEDATKTAEILTDSKAELTEWMEDGFKAAGKNPLAQAFAGKAA